MLDINRPPNPAWLDVAPQTGRFSIAARRRPSPSIVGVVWFATLADLSRRLETPQQAGYPGRLEQDDSKADPTGIGNGVRFRVGAYSIYPVHSVNLVVVYLHPW